MTSKEWGPPEQPAPSQGQSIRQSMPKAAPGLGGMDMCETPVYQAEAIIE